MYSSRGAKGAVRTWPSGGILGITCIRNSYYMQQLDHDSEPRKLFSLA